MHQICVVREQKHAYCSRICWGSKTCRCPPRGQRESNDLLSRVDNSPESCWMVSIQDLYAVYHNDLHCTVVARLWKLWGDVVLPQFLRKYRSGTPIWPWQRSLQSIWSLQWDKCPEIYTWRPSPIPLHIFPVAGAPLDTISNLQQAPWVFFMSNGKFLSEETLTFHNWRARYVSQELVETKREPKTRVSIAILSDVNTCLCCAASAQSVNLELNRLNVGILLVKSKKSVFSFIYAPQHKNRRNLCSSVWQNEKPNIPLGFGWLLSEH